MNRSLQSLFSPKIINRFAHGYYEGRSILLISNFPSNPRLSMAKPLQSNAIKSHSFGDKQDPIWFILGCFYSAQPSRQKFP